MTRAITFLGLIQLTGVLLGFLALGIVLKVCGYPEELPSIQWSRFAVFLRAHGLWLLSLPAIWVCYAVYSTHRDAGIYSEKVAFPVGAVLSVVIVVAFLYAAIFPFRRLVLILPT